METAPGGGGDLIATVVFTPYKCSQQCQLIHIKIRTTEKRESRGPAKLLLFLNYSRKGLRPPTRHRICGLYARFGKSGGIKSLGIMCVLGYAGEERVRLMNGRDI